MSEPRSTPSHIAIFFNEVIVGDLFGECIELGALGLGKNLNRHTPAVGTETLVFICA